MLTLNIHFLNSRTHSTAVTYPKGYMNPHLRTTALGHHFGLMYTEDIEQRYWAVKCASGVDKEVNLLALGSFLVVSAGLTFFHTLPKDPLDISSVMFTVAGSHLQSQKQRDDNDYSTSNWVFCKETCTLEEEGWLLQDAVASNFQLWDSWCMNVLGRER